MEQGGLFDKDIIEIKTYYGMSKYWLISDYKFTNIFLNFCFGII